eukprot:scaffold302198_cov19-Tisochrysis_lutea.AAC.1
MESTSIKDHIQVSAAFFKLLQEQWPEGARLAVDQPPVACPLRQKRNGRGVRTIKGKGAMKTYMLFPPEKEKESEQCRHLTIKVGQTSPFTQLSAAFHPIAEYRAGLIPPRKNIVFCPTGRLRARTMD